MHIAPFKNGLFTTSNDSHIFFYNFDEVETFADGDEHSNSGRDGTAIYSPFFSSTRIAVDFDNTAYVSNSSTSSIKFIAPLIRIVDFLDALHSLTKAFSLKEKHASYSVKTIGVAIKLVEQYLSGIQNNVDHIRHDRNIDLKSLNGPEGSISVASVDSLYLPDFRLRQLENNTEKLDYRKINLLSCMR